MTVYYISNPAKTQYVWQGIGVDIQYLYRYNDINIQFGGVLWALFLPEISRSSDAS